MHNRSTAPRSISKSGRSPAEHAAAALELATPEAYLANYPDREFTDEEVADRVAARKANALAANGWALFNQGETEAALARFEEADAVGGASYLGLPSSELYSYWGRALLSEGDLDRAIELLGAETAFGNNGSGSETYLREAYVAKNGDEEGFDEFMWSTRNQVGQDRRRFRTPRLRRQPCSAVRRRQRQRDPACVLVPHVRRLPRGVATPATVVREI